MKYIPPTLLTLVKEQSKSSAPPPFQTPAIFCKQSIHFSPDNTSLHTCTYVFYHALSSSGCPAFEWVAELD